MNQSEQQPDLQQATVRRAPKFGAFIAVGGLIGFLVTAIVTMQFPADPAIGMTALVAYFSIFGVSAGAAIGALLALVIDRRSRRNVHQVTVEHAEVASAEPIAAESPGDRESASTPAQTDPDASSSAAEAATDR
mgnify:CR=1 FL=1